MPSIYPISAPVVAVLAFDGISPFHLSVPCVVFGERYGGADTPRFKVLVCDAQGGRKGRAIPTSTGFCITAQYGLSALSKADIIVAPSWTAPHTVPPPALLQALRRAHQRGARIVGLCLGAYVLAEAGLLDGRSATTHWAVAPDFARRFPKVELDPNVLYVDQGDVTTSAGTAAGIDCCLHLLRAQYGADAAAKVARGLVVAPHRQGGQAQYIHHPLPSLASDDRLSGVLQWMQKNLAEAHSLDALAKKALMSRRSFTRRFHALTGTTVGQWLLHQRLAQVQRQLESTKLSVEQIAAETGFGSALMLRRHFAAAFQTSPSSYRRAFQGN